MSTGSELNRQQLCAALSISESTVYRLESAGLPFTPVGRRGKRYDLAECKRWLRETAPTPAAPPPIVLNLPADAFSGIPDPEPAKPPMPRDALIRHHANKRRAARMQRTPSWADLEAMKEIYRRAAALTRETGIAHHVDHEFPLQGALVSGLHVENNLQILPASVNNRKYNHFEVQ